MSPRQSSSAADIKALDPEDPMKLLVGRVLLPALSLAALAAILPEAAAQKGAAPRGDSWSYSGKSGPANWSKLDKSFAICAEGQAQSPIDIPDQTVRKGDFPSMLFNYKPTPLAVTDNGRTVSAKYDPGSYFSLEGVKYDLQSIELHKPGEHKVNGKGHEMEAYLVHKGKGDKLGILVVPLDPGKENAIVKAILTNVPATKGKENEVPSVTINAVDLLPSSKDYYAYAGSATTPPCTENVEWFLLKNAVSVSPDQIARFGKLYPMNARPVQPIHGRDIRGSR
jgi:carbonic anhydrase